MDAGEASWRKLEDVCRIADNDLAGRGLEFRDRHLQRIIWEGLTLGQRLARLQDLCALVHDLRAMESVREPDRAALDGHR